MPPPRQPLFLARATYRKRRLRDGARILPIFGLLMLLLPLLWPQTARAHVAHWGLVFAVWAGLIAFSAGLSRELGEADAQTARDDDGDDGPDYTRDDTRDVLAQDQITGQDSPPPTPPQGPTHAL